jgi:hypothetical protein
MVAEIKEFKYTCTVSFTVSVTNAEIGSDQSDENEICRSKTWGENWQIPTRNSTQKIRGSNCGHPGDAYVVSTIASMQSKSLKLHNAYCSPWLVKQIKDDEMDRAYGKYEYKQWWWDRDHLQDVDVDGSVILKWSLMKEGGKEVSGFIWLMIWISGKLLKY